jgi:hypothetical protein
MVQAGPWCKELESKLVQPGSPAWLGLTLWNGHVTALPASHLTAECVQACITWVPLPHDKT